MALFQKNNRNNHDVQQKEFNVNNTYIDELVEHYKTRLLTEVNLEQITTLEEREKKLKIERYINQFMTEEKVVIPRNEKEVLLSKLIDESVGFGPLEPLLQDDDITEILVNGPQEIYIEKKGSLNKLISLLKMRRV